MSNLKINIINSQETKDRQEAKAAAINVAMRDLAAKEDNPAFSTAEHRARVDAVKTILRSFFTVRENIYEQARANRGQNRPFTAVKVYRTEWPRVSPADANKRYYEPLEQLGNVELRVSRDFSSHIVRVYL